MRAAQAPDPPTVTTTNDPAAASPMEVVVLGGGYAAVWGYRAMVRRLGCRLRAGTVRITVVSASTTHAFHGWTGEVLAGLVDHDRTRTPLSALVPRARLVHGVATTVDLDARTVTVAAPRSDRNSHSGQDRHVLRFDHLLVGVGSVDATTIPGLVEHGRSVKGEYALAETHAHLHDVMVRAAATSDPAERRRLLTVVVAGGGFAGVEMAAAIAERFRAVTARHDVLRTCPARVVLAHSGPALLPELRPRFDRMADYAARQLVVAGVDVRLGTRLDRVTADGAVLTDGPVAAATVLSTVGQAMVPLAGTEGLERDPDGRMQTDRWLRTSTAGVWAGGDTAAVPHVLRATPCPPTALWAIKHGVRVGDNIARSVRGRRPRRFRFPGLGQAASLGVGKGAVELYGVTLTGWPGWLARWAFFHWFMPSRRRALATIRDWFARWRHGPRLDAPDSVHALDAPRAPGAIDRSASSALAA